MAFSRLVASAGSAFAEIVGVDGVFGAADFLVPLAVELVVGVSAGVVALLSAQPGQMNADSSASTMTTAATAITAVSLPWDEDCSVFAIGFILAQRHDAHPMPCGGAMS